jgi:hypothetical protein
MDCILIYHTTITQILLSQWMMCCKEIYIMEEVNGNFLMYICFVIFVHLSAHWNVPYDPLNCTCICEFCAPLSAVLCLTILTWSTYICNVFTSKQVNSWKQQKYGHCSWWDLKPIFSVLAKASSNSLDPTLNSGVWIVDSLYYGRMHPVACVTINK